MRLETREYRSKRMRVVGNYPFSGKEGTVIGEPKGGHDRSRKKLLKIRIGKNVHLVQQSHLRPLYEPQLSDKAKQRKDAKRTN